MKHLLRLAPIAALLLIGGLTLYTYRDLSGRAFAADDYQWLLSVRDLAPAELLQHAFDPLAQQHFYRPLIWVIFWVQVQLFGLNPYGLHLVSLALHLLNALLIGLLALRLIGNQHISDQGNLRSGFVARSTACVFASAFVALHPAPFEAVVWISAQSELVGTALILLAIHVWIAPLPNPSPTGGEGREKFAMGLSLLARSGRGGQGVRAAIGATMLLALAMLAKESAILGLPLMFLLDTKRERQRWHYLLPLAITLAFVALQYIVGQENRVLREGLYGIGPQLITNPLRSLALIVAPLPGTEHADSFWLVPVGTIVALVVLGILVMSIRRTPADWRNGLAPLILALVLSLAPTAPFTSPPDSRYLYLPVAMMALVLSRIISHWLERNYAPTSPRFNTLGHRSAPILCVLIIIGWCMAFWWCSGELAVREWRFSAGNGPGGSLWRVAGEICAVESPRRMIMVEPPIAPPHVEAIVQLACGTNTRTLIVERDGIEQAIRTGSFVIGFPGGSATIEQRIANR
ncbi:MAG: hypothetical protein SH847_05890 [Roseiflexaceae bacterium]|nr:hypothetical protein [Roseiflexaceae bacterium]